MKKYLKGALLSLLLLGSANLVADCGSSSSSSQERRANRLTGEDVAGLYQFSGFSSTLSDLQLALPGAIQSQAVVGQLRLLRNGNGRINIVEFAAIVDGSLQSIRRRNVPFTYTLGPVNGFATASISDFPTPGSNFTFSLAFKKHEGKVVGFSQITTSDTAASPRWTLVQGERFD